MKLAAAYLLLIPAPIVFAIRALMAMGGAEMPGVALAIVGILSGAGMVVLIWAMWYEARAKAILAVSVALLGHYVVNRFIDPDLGGAMVYLGTSMAAALRQPRALWAGLVAAIGALLRHSEVGTFGQALLAAGALGLSLFLALAARDAFNNREPDQD